MKTLQVIIVIVAVSLVTWFALHHSATTPSISNAISCPDCNVIVIGVDTLRADHVHALGYPLATTPTIDALATKGFIFSQAISASSWTVPSFMSILTGVYPSVHKVVNKYDVFTATTKTISNLHNVSPQIETLAQAMKTAGYATGGFTGDAGVGHPFGYNQGFDVYTDEQTFGGFNNSEKHALSWLDSLAKNQKFFMFFHGYDLHGQFNLPQRNQIFVPSDYHGSYTGSSQEESVLREAQLTPAGISLTPADVAFWKGLYDSKIHAADAQIADLLAQLDKRGLLQKTIVVVVSDHGEEFYEHGGIDHGQSLYNELIHVPLIIDVPGTTGGKSIPAQVTTMDVAPTIFNILGITPDATFATQQEGQSLLPYMTGGKTGSGSDVFIETDYRDFTHKRAVRTADGWVYILTLESGQQELYNLATDPAEKKNIITSEPAETTKLRSELEDHMRTDLKEDPNIVPAVGCLPVYAGECI